LAEEFSQFESKASCGSKILPSESVFVTAQVGLCAIERDNEREEGLKSFWRNDGVPLFGVRGICRLSDVDIDPARRCHDVFVDGI
jgi:hypothetical protein